MWYPQIQFTFRFYDPATKKTEWRSTNVTNFNSPAASSSSTPSYDKRSSKSDQFSILLDPSKPDSYAIEGNYDADTQVSLKFKRAEGVPGWKLGSGPKGGFTYFGPEKQSSSKEDGPDHAAGTDGYCIHRFWPRCNVTGILRIGKEIISMDELAAKGVFIHAIQGMRPNLIASRWNFGYFNSEEEKDGVSLLMMEFTTASGYEKKVINVGSVVVDDKLVAVIADGSVEHLETVGTDADTGHNPPNKIVWNWNNGRSLLPSASAAPAENATVSAKITLNLGSDEKKQGASAGARQFKGLIEKVDVLAQIPYLVKKVLSYVAGLKPFIYQVCSLVSVLWHLADSRVAQFHNPATAEITLPSDDGKDVRTLSVQGFIFNEATFISD